MDRIQWINSVSQRQPIQVILNCIRKKQMLQADEFAETNHHSTLFYILVVYCGSSNIKIVNFYMNPF
jgi:hypothetical protein